MTNEQKRKISETMKARGIDNSRNFRNLSPDQEARRRKNIAEGHLEHGCRIADTKSAEFHAYSTWAAMKQRCDNPRCRSYQNYGGRGITICDRWYKFENFLEDMGLPLPGRSLDRIDNDGNYCKENCRWSTRKEQADNRRTSRILDVFGERMSLIDLSRKTGIAHSTLRLRLEKTGGVVNAFVVTPPQETPVRKQSRLDRAAEEMREKNSCIKSPVGTFTENDLGG